MEELYGEKNSEQFSEKNHSESNVKIELDGLLSENVSSQNSMIEGEIEAPHGYTIENIVIEKLVYIPHEFELKIAVCLVKNPEIKRILTCSEMMKIHPETALMCYKAKIAAIKKWKTKFLPFK